VKEQLGFSAKSKNREIAQEMTLEEFQGTDLLDFCKNILTILNKEGAGVIDGKEQ
jgi:hypothetical protein